LLILLFLVWCCEFGAAGNRAVAGDTWADFTIATSPVILYAVHSTPPAWRRASKILAASRSAVCWTTGDVLSTDYWES
jgi:hypothetical protein